MDNTNAQTLQLNVIDQQVLSLSCRHASMGPIQRNEMESPVNGIQFKAKQDLCLVEAQSPWSYQGDEKLNLVVTKVDVINYVTVTG